MTIPVKGETATLFQFGAFTLDLQRRGLYKDGERVHLTSKPLEVLIYLVHNRGRAVEKRELLDTVWNGVFVTEDNLVQAIMEIRRALGDNKYDPHFIQTIPRQGYRFVGVVLEETALRRPPTDASLTDHESRNRPREHLISRAKGKPGIAAAGMSALAIILVGVAFSLYMLFLQGRTGSNPGTSFEKFRVTRATISGKVTSAAISPDGKYLVYATNLDGQESLWLRQTAAASDVQVTETVALSPKALTFSVDSSSLYYVVRNSNGLGELYQMPVLGGIPRKLVADVDSGISFSPDGKQICFFRGYPENSETKLVIANADGTHQRELVTRKRPDYFPTSFDAAPAWSPIGAVIACPVGRNDGDDRYMTVGRLQTDGGAIVPITSQRWSQVGRVEWLHDESGLIIVARERAADPSQIWHLSYPTGEARRVTNDLNNYTGVSLTREPSPTLVTIQSIVLSSILISPDEGDAKEIPVSSLDGVAGICWTPDGQIVYSARLTGNQDIYVMDQGGNNQKQLTSGASDNNWPSVSPDGRSIVFMSNRTGSNSIWRMDIDGSNLRRLTSSTDDRWPCCTPDGKAVIYASVSNPPGLFKVSIEGGPPMRLTNVRPAQPAISPDGLQVAAGYFEDPGANKTAIYSSEGGAPLKVLNFSSFYLRWTPDGRTLANIDRSTIQNIVSLPTAGGASRQLTHFKDGVIVSFDWSRDGRLACSRKVLIADAVTLRNY